MKRILIPLIAAALISSCAGNGNKQEDSDAEIKIVPIDLPDNIVEVRGTVGKNTSMNVLELITTEGDTLLINTPGQMATGGQNVGDELDVIYSVNNEELTTQIAINISALQHFWCQKSEDGHTQGLELNSNNHAVTYDMAINYDKWAIKDGTLLLYSPQKIGAEKSAIADTFEILMLTEDSLVLASPTHPVVSTFYREN